MRFGTDVAWEERTLENAEMNKQKSPRLHKEFAEMNAQNPPRADPVLVVGQRRLRWIRPLIVQAEPAAVVAAAVFVHRRLD